MDLLVTLIAGTVQALLSITELCFLARAILSLFPLSEDNPFLVITAMVTEPIILPFRTLFDRFGWFQNSPLDIPFFVAFLFVQMLGVLLLL